MVSPHRRPRLKRIPAPRPKLPEPSDRIYIGTDTNGDTWLLRWAALGFPDEWSALGFVGPKGDCVRRPATEIDWRSFELAPGWR